MIKPRTRIDMLKATRIKTRVKLLFKSIGGSYIQQMIVEQSFANGCKYANKMPSLLD